jgi:hypothetical protein
MRHEIYTKKLDEKGNPIFENGDFVMELNIISDTENKLSNEELNKLQHDELLLTDWYFTRKIELGIEVPSEIIKQRLEIRNKYK